MDSHLTAELQARLAELQEIFHQQLPGRIDELQATWQVLCDNWNKESLTQLHRMCHGLAGSAGTFGAHEVSRQAQTLEQHLKQLVAAESETGEASTRTKQQLGEHIRALAQSSTTYTAAYAHHMTPCSELKKVLYVEDDASIQLVTRLALEEVGRLEVKVCSSGQEAVTVADAFAPDLILLDVMMPGLNGPDTLLELRKRALTKNTPAMFMTAKVQPHEVEELNQLPGTIGVIAKPFEPMTLASQLQEAWKHYQQQG